MSKKMQFLTSFNFLLQPVGPSQYFLPAAAGVFNIRITGNKEIKQDVPLKQYCDS